MKQLLTFIKSPRTSPILLSKLLLLSSVLLSATSFCSFAQNETTLDCTTLRIQLGAFRDLSNVNTDGLSEFGGILSEELPNGVHRLTVGDFDDRPSAEDALKGIKKLGFANAFVNTVSIPCQEEENLTEEETDETYLVQLGVYSKIELSQFNAVAELGEVYTNVVKGSIRVCLGKYDNRVKAEQILSKAKQLGFVNAFIKEEEH